MLTIDRKFIISATNPCKPKNVYTEENCFLVSAKDKAAIPMLEAYHKACVELQCDDSHLESTLLLIERVRAFQAHYGWKIPDTETGCEIDRCIGGKL